MRVEKREHIVERKKEYDLYIARDGATFRTKYECRMHEVENGLLDLPVIKSVIEEVKTFDGDAAQMYYLKSKDDVEAVNTYNNTLKSNCDFDKYGEGWYISICNYGDYPSHELLNYEAYVIEHRKLFDGVVSHNQQLIRESAMRRKP